MPCVNSLASSYGLATQCYASAHPSIENYFMLVTGQIVTNHEALTPLRFTADNLVRELLVAGNTWKSYAEGLPPVRCTGVEVYP